MTSVQTGEDYIRVLEELQQSAEWKLHQQLMSLDRSYRLFISNSNELLKLLNLLGKEEIAWRLFNDEGRELGDRLLEEVTRLLHNFVAASKSLVAHTRRHTTDLYQGTDFDMEYQAEKAMLVAAPVQRFIQDLRSYAQHYELPMVGAQMHITPGAVESGAKMDVKLLITPGAVESGAKMDVKLLIRWTKWHKLSKQYMAKWNECIPLEEPVREYMALVANFYRWLYQREEDIHATALSYVREISAELQGYGERTSAALKAKYQQEQANENAGMEMEGVQ